MSPKAKALSVEAHRARLERRANVIRSRLLRTIDALDERRHQVQEIGHHAKRMATSAGTIFVGAVVVTAGAALAVRALIHSRRERHLAHRMMQALAPLRREKRLAFWSEALRKVGLTALGVIAGELAKRGSRALLASREPRLLPGR